MQDKLTALRKLIDDGYELEHVQSESGYVEARFHHPSVGHRTTLRLFASDAERLLYAPRKLGRVWIRR